MPSPDKKISPNKKYHFQEEVPRISPAKHYNERLFSKNYFCHYSNAVYMGGMDCFKKLGQGIILMDNGTCAITCYSHDNMINHNMIFRDGSLTSIIVNLDKSKSICFRSGGFLTYYKLSSKDIIEGIGFYVNYKHQKLFRIKYEKGYPKVKQKVTDEKILRKILSENDLRQIIEQPHCRALLMNFQLPPEIVKNSANDRHVIGFYSSQLKAFHGLYFKVIVKQFLSDYDVIIEQRGYVNKEIMDMYGEKHFENGNYYVGQFKEGMFHGFGVLIYPKQKNWTLGEYYKGQLKNVKQSYVQNPTKSYQYAIRKIHEYSKPYIQFKMELQPKQKQLRLLSKTLEQKDPLEHESIDYTREQKKRQTDLNTIQTDYVNRRFEDRTERAIKDLLGDKKKKQKSNSKRDGVNPSESPNQKKSKGTAKGAINIKYLDPNRKETKGLKQKSSEKKTRPIQQSPSEQKERKLEDPSQERKVNDQMSRQRDDPINRSNSNQRKRNTPKSSYYTKNNYVNDFKYSSPNSNFNNQSEVKSPVSKERDGNQYKAYTYSPYKYQRYNTPYNTFSPSKYQTNMLNDPKFFNLAAQIPKKYANQYEPVGSRDQISNNYPYKSDKTKSTYDPLYKNYPTDTLNFYKYWLYPEQYLYTRRPIYRYLYQNDEQQLSRRLPTNPYLRRNLY